MKYICINLTLIYWMATVNFIVTHSRLYGEEKESMSWVPYLELMSKRPTALKYTGLFNQFPTILKNYMNQCDYETKKQAIGSNFKHNLLACHIGSGWINSSIKLCFTIIVCLCHLNYSPKWLHIQIWILQ